MSAGDKTKYRGKTVFVGLGTKVLKTIAHLDT